MSGNLFAGRFWICNVREKRRVRYGQTSANPASPADLKAGEWRKIDANSAYSVSMIPIGTKDTITRAGIKSCFPGPS